MRKFLGTLILYLLFVTNTYSLENRVTSYADDGLEAWFTFEYSKKDVFTLKIRETLCDQLQSLSLAQIIKGVIDMEVLLVLLA